jgi:hypothetical protein
MAGIDGVAGDVEQAVYAPAKSFAPKGMRIIFKVGASLSLGEWSFTCAYAS